MTGKFPRLEKAENETKAGRIKDPWTFNFVASDGFNRLKEDILKLRDEEKYLVYILSAYTSMVGESYLTSTEFILFVIKINQSGFSFPIQILKKH